MILRVSRVMIGCCWSDGASVTVQVTAGLGRRRRDAVGALLWEPRQVGFVVQTAVMRYFVIEIGGGWSPCWPARLSTCSLLGR
jgi:hypothetical protein